MLKRTLSGAVITVVILVAVFFSYVPFVFNAFMGLVTAVGMYEMLKAGGVAKHKVLTACSVLFAGGFVFCSAAFDGFRPWLTAATVLLVFAAFTYYLKNYSKITLGELIFALAMTLMIAYFFSTLVLVRAETHGLWHLILIFVLSWIPDTGAYLCGSAFGKHKLAPVVSPKKTIEGAVGGLIICVGLTFLYAWIVARFAEGVSVHYWAVALYAVPGTLISILGDLTASLIKRHYGIKDYGTLIPGHGGIMDRFDSIWFVAPFVWMMTGFIPVFF